VQEDLQLVVKEMLVEPETLHSAQRVAGAALVLLDLLQVVV